MKMIKRHWLPILLIILTMSAGIFVPAKLVIYRTERTLKNAETLTNKDVIVNEQVFRPEDQPEDIQWKTYFDQKESLKTLRDPDSNELSMQQAWAIGENVVGGLAKSHLLPDTYRLDNLTATSVFYTDEISGRGYWIIDYFLVDTGNTDTNDARLEIDVGNLGYAILKSNGCIATLTVDALTGIVIEVEFTASANDLVMSPNNSQPADFSVDFGIVRERLRSWLTEMKWDMSGSDFSETNNQIEGYIISEDDIQRYIQVDLQRHEVTYDITRLLPQGEAGVETDVAYMFYYYLRVADE